MSFLLVALILYIQRSLMFPLSSSVTIMYNGINLSDAVVKTDGKRI